MSVITVKQVAINIHGHFNAAMPQLFLDILRIGSLLILRRLLKGSSADVM